MDKYVQKVVWVGTVLGDATTEDFENYFSEELGFRVKYDSEFKMIGGYFEGLNCIVFSLHSDDIPKFALFRIQTGDMKWLDDFCDNEGENVPCEVYSRYGEYLN